MLLQAPRPGRVPTPAPAARPGQRRTGSVQWRDAAWAGPGWAGLGWAGLGWAGLGRAGLVWDTGEMEIAWCVGMPGHVITRLMHAACCMLQCGTIRLLQEAVKQCEWTLQLLVASGVG